MATLKISDLSVGDWVKFRGNICTICSIYKSVMRIPNEVSLLSKDCYLGVAPVCELSPILITPEILEANGFVKNGGMYKWSNKKHRVFVWLKEPSCYVDVEGMDEQLDTKSSLIKVSQLYAHQLQHALRLAGVEKEIVMPKE